jgi:hypothetical protein
MRVIVSDRPRPWAVGLCQQVSGFVKISVSLASQRRSSILVSAGKVATNWSERGIALGGLFYMPCGSNEHPSEHL